MFNTDEIVLVDINGNETGFMEKSKHTEPADCTGFFNIYCQQPGDLLLQQRAATKYHSGGLWSNTCCSHPLQERRFYELLTVVCMKNLVSIANVEIFTFTYRADVGSGLIEHEHDHVLLGKIRRRFPSRSGRNSGVQMDISN